MAIFLNLHMRNLLIAFFLILALNIHVHAQKRAIHNNTYKEIKWGQKDHYHDFQFLFIDGEPQLSDSTTKSLALDFLQSISLYNIIDREKEINYLYQNRLSFSHSDTLLLLNTYRVYALQQYVEKQYNKSIQGFEAYFRLYESYFHSNIYPGFEFTKYTVCFKKKRDYKRFIQLLESEIKKVENIGEYNSYQAQYLIESGKHFSNQRQLDTARHILSKAKLLLSDKKKEEFYIKSNLFKQLGYLELFSSNIELAINYFNIAIDNLLETKHSNVQMANLYNDLAKAYYIDNQLKKADSYFSMALAIYELELRPNHSVIINTYRYLGLINYGLSDYTNAIAYLKKSISLDPAPKRYLSYRNLAEVYAKTDSIELAQKYYALSLKNTIITQGENSYQSAISYLAYGEFLLLKTPFTQKGEDYIAKTIELEYEIFQEKSIDFIEPLNILGKYYIQDGQINRGLDSLQSALIQAIENFHSRDIYTNPQSEKSIRESSFTNTLAWKAYGFYLKYIETNYIEDLKMSLLTYNHFIYVAKETRKYFEETESVIDAGQLDYVFGQAIDIGNQLYQITGERKYLEQVFRFIEGKKSYTLFTSLSILEKKRLLNIPKELLKKEQKLKYSLGLLNEKISIEQAIKRSNKIIDLEKNAFTITQSLDSIQKIYKEQYSGFYNLKYGFNELSLSEIEEKTKENQAFLYKKYIPMKVTTNFMNTLMLVAIYINY
ncbi:MAG: hypothetical protein B7C24_09380 [Bacteroidetes bacterium 4572_77]|nr:MAG: hypothetical protein B7C24_09380 [Bacteroidetes bacterium 4572_77]